MSLHRGKTMLNYIFAIGLTLLALQVDASTKKDFETRKVWVSELRSFILDLEAKNPKILSTQAAKELIFRFQVFQSAYADADNDCFFAGWPGKLVQSGEKKLCPSPSAKSGYSPGNCPSGQLQCQPLLFGKDLCVSFASSKDKQLAFSKCSGKFKAENRSMDFLQSLTSQEKESLKEVSRLAVAICKDGSVGIQKSKPMCTSLLSKVDEAIGAIDRAPASVEQSPVSSNLPVTEKEVEGQVIEFEAEIEVRIENGNDPVVAEEATVPSDGPKPNIVEEICEPVVDEHVRGQSNDIILTVNKPVDELYDEIDARFQNSDFCVPAKVMSTPSDRLDPILFNASYESLSFVNWNHAPYSPEHKMKLFKEFTQNYGLSEEVLNFGLDEIKKSSDPDSRNLAALRIRALVIKEMTKKQQADPTYQSDKIREGLFKHHVFVKHPDTQEIQCPFVSIDAFRKAMAGREAVLKSAQKDKLTNPDQLTIVDYSRPSNERRMFVIDLKTNTVLENTWVAHGGGKDAKGFHTETNGKDGFGSSPMVSNQSGSQLSSDGFYVAISNSTGNKYGENVILDGIDQNNSNMKGRQIILHGWNTPFARYNSTVDYSGGKKQVSKDVVAPLYKMDHRTASLQDLTVAFDEVRSETYYSPIMMGSTDGCLGVAGNKVSKMQQALPGSLMFNYTGSGMKSKYLD